MQRRFWPFLDRRGTCTGRSPYFFYITNVRKEEQSAEELVFAANKRCDQENIISQLKGMGALAAPLHSTISHGAYMAMATLA